MKLGRFEINKTGMYWDDLKFVHPLRILTSLILYVPYHTFLVLTMLLSAAYYRHWYVAEQLWDTR